MQRKRLESTEAGAFSEAGRIVKLPVEKLHAHPLLCELYEEDRFEDLVESLRSQGQLQAVTVEPHGDGYRVLSGGRRLRAVRKLGWRSVEAVIREPVDDEQRKWWILEWNHQRAKSFSERMREADLMEGLLKVEARQRSQANLRQGPKLRVVHGWETDGEDGVTTESLNSDSRSHSDEMGVGVIKEEAKRGVPRRTDQQVARAIGLGGKDLYRQARTVWKMAREGDARASAAVGELDAGQKSVHAAFKDLRRRNHLAEDFRPTPYDVWSFKHDPAYGTRYPGSIPAGIIANTLYYFSEPGALVVDPMAGGGTTIDVCASLGRRCLAYDLAPSRAEIRRRDLFREGLAEEARGCDLIFLDPPYYTMLADRYKDGSLSKLKYDEWIESLKQIYADCHSCLRPGGILSVLIANQTEKDVPEGSGYIDHVFESMGLLMGAGFEPVRRISCPMSGAYRPDQVNESRAERRMLGQVRDLIVMHKPK